MKKTFYLFALLLAGCLRGQAQIITTIAGNGTAGSGGDGGAATAAELYMPYSVAVDNSGNVYISDYGNHKIKKISTSGIINTIAGTGTAGFSGDGGPGSAAQLQRPTGICVDRHGDLFICDEGNSCIRKVNSSGIITTYAGTAPTGGYTGDGGPATMANLAWPSAMTFDTSDNLYIAERINSVIRKVNSSGIISTVAGTGTSSYGPDGGMATATMLNDPTGVAIDAIGNIYIEENNGNRIRKVSTSGIISTIAGSGVAGFSVDGVPATSAQIHGLMGIVVDGSSIYFTDTDNDRIRKVGSDGILGTVAGGGASGLGDGRAATSASLNYPLSITLDKNNSLYIADSHNNRVRYIRNTTAVHQISAAAHAVKIFPNPNNGTFEARVSSGHEEDIAIRLIDITGKCLKEVKARTNEAVPMVIAQPGVYSISVSSKDEVITDEVIVR